MALQRFWLAVIVLLSLQLTAAASSVARYVTPHQHLAKTLKNGQFKTLLEDFVLSYQRQTHAITISRSQADQPHRLMITSSGAIEGDITINGELVQILKRGSTTINITPYLEAGDVSVFITGRYDPADAPVVIRFDGPDTNLNHRSAESGYLSYHIDLQVQ